MTSRLFILATAAALFATGCASGGSVSSFRGVQFPVMLGAKNRIAAPAPTPVTKVNDWYAEAVNFARADDIQGAGGTYRVTTSTETASSFMAEEAEGFVESEHKSDATLEMTVTLIQAYDAYFREA